MVHDMNFGNWKMERSIDGQYVPYLDFTAICKDLELKIESFKSVLEDANKTIAYLKQEIEKLNQEKA